MQIVAKEDTSAITVWGITGRKQLNDMLLGTCRLLLVSCQTVETRDQSLEHFDLGKRKWKVKSETVSTGVWSTTNCPFAILPSVCLFVCLSQRVSAVH